MSSLLFKAQWHVLTHLPWVRGLVKHCWESGACLPSTGIFGTHCRYIPLGGSRVISAGVATVMYLLSSGIVGLDPAGLMLLLG